MRSVDEESESAVLAGRVEARPSVGQPNSRQARFEDPSWTSGTNSAVSPTFG